MRISARFLFFNSIISLFFLLFILPNSSFAATYFDVPIPSGENYTVVSNSFCAGPPECANSQNYSSDPAKNNCGLPRCTGGIDWAKYELTCILVVDEDRHDNYYERGGVVYSIGDKCTSGGPYLDPGYCTTPYGGPIYKTCCSNTGNEISPYACVPINNLDNAGDIEGRCPAGYEREEFCGFNGIPCGQEACGPIVP